MLHLINIVFDDQRNKFNSSLPAAMLIHKRIWNSSAALEPNSITNLSRKYDFQWITQFGNKTRPQECEDAYMASTYTFGASGELISFGRLEYVWLAQWIQKRHSRA